MRGTPFRVGPFTGGLNLRDPLIDVPFSQSPDCMNVIAGPDGAIRKRDPVVTIQNTFVGSVGQNLSFAFVAESVGSAGNAPALVGGFGKVWSVAASNAAVTDITGATAPSSFQVFANAVASGGQGPVYGAGGAAVPPLQWTGAGNLAAWTASAGTLGTPDGVVYFKNRMFMWGASAGAGSNPNKLYASKVGDPRNWDTTVSGADSAWAIDIDPGDGQPIGSVIPFGPYLVIFKARKIYVIYDLDTGANRLVHRNLGCWRFQSISDSPYGLIFLATDGHIWIMEGEQRFQKLSDIISHTQLRGALSPGAGQPNWGQNTNSAPGYGIDCGIFHDDKYYITNTAAGHTFVYDFNTKTWLRHDYNAWKLFRWNDATANNVSRLSTLYATMTSGGSNLACVGFPKNAGSVQDLGVNYNAYWETPPIAPSGKANMPEIRRRYHAWRGYVGGVVDLQTSSVIYGAPTTIASFNAGNVQDVREQTKYSLGVSNVLRVRLSSTDANNWLAYPFTIWTQPRTD